MFDSLLTLIRSLVALDDTEIPLLAELFEMVEVKKETVIEAEDTVCSHVYFVVSGYLRYYSNTDLGTEQTIHLLGPEEFATSLQSFISGKASGENLAAVTDCSLLRISREKLEFLYASGAKWQEFGRKVMELTVLEKEKRIIQQISYSAKERYAILLEQRPELAQNIPVQYLASYLGIQPESLSRIRRKVF
ncbi:MAG: cAMP-binding protein [Crocinitomicaceae bacterium]|jgi:CRP-like cAMP-binding protein|nr:cAMP-binding protein [Crocinitomicaceae bacterium]